jgi:hypothetical protein
MKSVFCVLVCLVIAACVPESDDCTTVHEEIPLAAGQFEVGAELSHTPPAVYVNQAEAVWNLPSDTFALHALVGASDVGTAAATVITAVSEYDLQDTISGSEVYESQETWTVERDTVTVLDLALSDDFRPKSFYLRHEGGIEATPLMIFSLEIERQRCGD